jgi:hypothetical protein
LLEIEDSRKTKFTRETKFPRLAQLSEAEKFQVRFAKEVAKLQKNFVYSSRCEAKQRRVNEVSQVKSSISISTLKNFVLIEEQCLLNFVFLIYQRGKKCCFFKWTICLWLLSLITTLKSKISSSLNLKNKVFQKFQLTLA